MLKLFISGSTTRSTRAVESVKRLCEQHIANRYQLEILDVYADPSLIRDLQIVATPTLVRIVPSPTRYIVGDLADEAKVLSGLELHASPPPIGDWP